MRRELRQLDWRDYLDHQNPVAAALMAKMKIAKNDQLGILPGLKQPGLKQPGRLFHIIKSLFRITTNHQIPPSSEGIRSD